MSLNQAEVTTDLPCLPITIQYIQDVLLIDI